MRNLDAEKPSLGETLFELGWQQGTLFSAPSACFSLNKFSDQDPDKPIVQETRKTKPNEKFVLISQDCDIVASEAENDEPNVEAILCKPEKQKFEPYGTVLILILSTWTPTCESCQRMKFS